MKVSDLKEQLNREGVDDGDEVFIRGVYGINTSISETYTKSFPEIEGVSFFFIDAPLTDKGISTQDSFNFVLSRTQKGLEELQALEKSRKEINEKE